MAIETTPRNGEVRATLRDISHFITKGATPTTYGFQWQSSGIMFLRSECVAEGGLDLRQSMYISPIAHHVLRRSQVTDGDLLITITGNVGRVVRVLGLGVANINQHIARVRVNDPRFDPAYVYHFLSQRSVRQHYQTIVTGQAYPQISLSQVRDTVVVGPALTVQRKIAGSLDDVDQYTARLERLIAKKRTVRDGLMQQLLSGRTRLPGFTEPWHEVSILDLVGGQRSLFNDGDWIESPHITTSGSRLLQTGNVGIGQLLDRGTKRYISDDSFEALRCKEVVPGDLLICRLADPAGRACIVNDIGERRMLTSVDVTIYRPSIDVADRRFLVAVFSTPGWFQAVSERCGGSTRTRIARSELGRIKIPLPGLEEQSRIADALSDSNDEIAALERRLAKAHSTKVGMTQVLFAGISGLPAVESAR